jgi:excisionase family DNA binding protein
MIIQIDISDLLFELEKTIKESFRAMKLVKPYERPVTQKELSEFLGVTPQTIIRWRKKGKIPFIMVGSVPRYNKDVVIKALEKK